jgi:hypothetical protein
MNWFKLVGTTKDPVPPDWEHEDPGMFTRLHFPRNKRPNKLSNGERIVVYAVRHGLLIATQTVESTAPASRERKGAPGSPEHRWPWEIWVKTHAYCSPLASAPALREVAPDFADRHSNKFRDGSHWPITDAEYLQLAGAIEANGRFYESSSGAPPNAT